MLLPLRFILGLINLVYIVHTWCISLNNVVFNQITTKRTRFFGLLFPALKENYIVNVVHFFLLHAHVESRACISQREEMRRSAA